MTSVKSLIDGALRSLRLIQSGDQADPTEYADGLQSLRVMLDAWSLEDLLIPYSPTETFPLVEGQYFYSVGTAGDWDTIRPEQILSLRLLDAGGTSWPMREEAMRVREMQSTVQVGRPSAYLLQRDARFMFVEFDCLPEAGLSALLTTLKPFNVRALDNFDQAAPEPATIHPSGFTLTGIQTAIEFPPGYEQAIQYNLAIHLAPEYGREAPATVIALASSAKALIKRRNWRKLTSLPDPALAGGACVGTYDVTAGPG